MADETPSRPITRKMGRPKGSKNRPKDIIEAERRMPKRPRGRPKGSKNKPKDIAGFLVSSLNGGEIPKPVVPPRPKNKNLIRPQLWKGVPPEVKREWCRKGAAASNSKPHRHRGSAPPGWTREQYEIAQKTAKREARRIFNIMADKGLTPKDEAGQEALLLALQLMREPGKKDFKLKAARTILEYTTAKPTTKSEVTVKTAEDFLDELVEDDDEPDTTEE